MVRAVAALFGLAILVASCSDSRTGPHSPTGPRANGEMYCNMDAWKCDILRAGIQYDIDHANEQCRAAGYAALARFEAPWSTGWGYEEATPPTGSNNQMWVNMVPGQSPSGGVPVDGKVWVSTYLWSSGNSTAQNGSLMAHEEQHQNGYDYTHVDVYGNTPGEGQKMFDRCMNPSA